MLNQIAPKQLGERIVIPPPLPFGVTRSWSFGGHAREMLHEVTPLAFRFL
jgi:hypothetical protein